MAAHLHGQTLNLGKLARAMDLSYHTIAHYLDILESAFVIRRLKLGRGIEAVPWRDVARGGRFWPGVC